MKCNYKKRLKVKNLCVCVCRRERAVGETDNGGNGGECNMLFDREMVPIIQPEIKFCRFIESG